MSVVLLAPTAKRATRGEVLVLLAGVAAALVLRVAVLDARSLWFDEAFSVAIARLPAAQIWNLIARTDAHPPLYYLLLHVWLLLGDSPGVIRSLSLVSGMLTVAVAWFFARELGGRALATVTAVLLGTAALAVQASVEARMHALLGLLALGATYALWRAATGESRPWVWAAYTATMALAFYVDYFAFLLVPAHLLYLALHHRRERAVQMRFLLALGAALLAYTPWWPAVAQQLAGGRADRIWQGAMPLTAPLNMVALSSFGGYLLGLGGYLLDDGRWSWGQVLLVLPFLVLLGAGTVTMVRRGAGTLLLLVWAVPVAILIGASVVTGLFYAIPRYAAFVQPFFILLLAQGILALALRERRTATLIVLTTGIIVLNLAVLGATFDDPRYQPYNWAAAARYVEARWQPGDGLLFYPQTARVAFGYYFTERGSDAVTLYAQPWTSRPSRAALVRALPPISALLHNADRVWVVLTEPAPPESRQALLAALERTYRRREGVDFRYVYVLLYERR